MSASHSREMVPDTISLSREPASGESGLRVVFSLEPVLWLYGILWVTLS
jgi:hypothetical protein